MMANYAAITGQPPQAAYSENPIQTRGLPVNRAIAPAIDLDTLDDYNFPDAEQFQASKITGIGPSSNEFPSKCSCASNETPIL